MSSRSNDIHTDIRDLLGTDTLTPEMERVVSVMRTYRPRVDIDASYRNKLKKSLLTPSAKKTTHTRPSWFAWMSWVGTSFAALIVTLGVVRVLFPERPITPEHMPLTVESPLPEVATLMQDATVSMTPTSETVTESNLPKRIIPEQDTLPMARMADVQTTEPAESTPTPPVANTASDTAPDMLADASMGGGYMMMATPETAALAKTATPTTTTTESPSPDTSSDISSEIQDMVWEINAIINEAGSTQALTLPDYPTEMPIYTKETGFTTEEVSLLAGSGITSTTVATYSPDRLESLIIDLRGDMTLTGTPEIRYISYKKGNQSILVPTVIYMTSIGTSLELALVPGY